MDTQVEFLKHLRTTHFTLVLTTLAILVSSSLSRVALLETAYQQITEVETLNSRLTSARVGALVEDLLADRPEGALSLHAQQEVLLWHVSGVDHPIREARRPPPRPLIWIPGDIAAYSPSHSAPPSIMEDPRKRTYQEFQDAWGFLRNGSRAFLIRSIQPEEATFRVPEDSPESYDLAQAILWRSEGVGDEDREFITGVSVELDKPSGVPQMVLRLIGGQSVDPHLIVGLEALIPIGMFSHALPLLEEFLDAEGGFDDVRSIRQRDGDFHVVYRDLDEYAKGLETLELDQLREYIDRLRREKGPQVEVFGTAIPQTAISTWGLAVLIGTQLVFSCHLMRFLDGFSNRSRGQDYPWIGLYPNRLSRWLTQGSIAAAPVVGLIAVAKGWENLGSLLQRSLAVAGVVVTLAISSLTVRLLRRLRGG